MEKLLHIVMILGFIYAAWSAVWWGFGLVLFCRAENVAQENAIAADGAVQLRRLAISLVISLTIYFVA